MALPLPIDVPPRAVLHYRARLALSLLAQRPPTRCTARLVELVLTGRLDDQFHAPVRRVE